MFFLSLAALILILVACASSTSSSPSATTIVQNYVNAINTKQLDSAVSFLADDAFYTTPQDKIHGKDAIRAYLKELMDLGYRSENSNYRESNGEVRFDYKVFLGTEQVDQNTDGLTIVKNGKIVFDGLEKDKP